MKRASFVLAMLALVAFCGLAFADIHMVADPSQPAAMGAVSLGHDDNGNTVMSVHVQHLADPAALTPAQQSYAVWIQEPGKEPQFIGNLAVDKNLKGELRAPVPARAFDVFITAETNPHPDTPSSMKVLHATVQATATGQ